MEFNIKDLNIISIVQDCFIKSSDNIKINIYSSFIMKLYNSTLWDFYNLNDIFLDVNNFNEISKNIDYIFIIDILYQIKNQYGLSYNDDFIQKLKKMFDKNLYNFLDNFFWENMCEFSEEIVNNAVDDYICENGIEDISYTFDINCICKDISSVIDKLSDIIEKVNSVVFYHDKEALISDIENNYDIEDFFKEALYNNYYYNYYDKIYRDDYIPDDDMDPIDIIFDRDFK